MRRRTAVASRLLLTRPAAYCEDLMAWDAPQNAHVTASTTARHSQDPSRPSRKAEPKGRESTAIRVIRARASCLLGIRLAAVLSCDCENAQLGSHPLSRASVACCACESLLQKLLCVSAVDVAHFPTTQEPDRINSGSHLRFLGRREQMALRLEDPIGAESGSMSRGRAAKLRNLLSDISTRRRASIGQRCAGLGRRKLMLANCMLRCCALRPFPDM